MTAHYTQTNSMLIEISINYIYTDKN